MCYSRPLKTLRHYYLSNGESSPPPFYETWADRCRYTLLLTAVAVVVVGLGPSNSPSQSVVLHNIKKSRL